MAGERAVVVGAGGIAGAWFPAIVAEKVNVLAVVDLSKQAAEKRIKEFDLDAEAATDLKATLEKTRPDFVIDLTTPQAHCAVTCTALKAGCHVIGEKPMAASMAEARKMVRTAEQTGKMYMVSQSRRWNPLHDQIRRAIASGKIGRVTTINCDFFIGAHFGGFRDEMESPLLLDMAIHQFDLARFFTAADPVAVYANQFNPIGSWYAGGASACCIFEMNDGVMFDYRGSWCSEGCHTSWDGDWRIIGDKGTLLYRRDEEPTIEVLAGKRGFHRPLKNVKLPAARLKFQRMHGALREMLAFIRTGRGPQTLCHDNIKSLAMVFAAVESAGKSRRVSLRI